MRFRNLALLGLLAALALSACTSSGDPQATLTNQTSPPPVQANEVATSESPSSEVVPWTRIPPPAGEQRPAPFDGGQLAYEIEAGPNVAAGERFKFQVKLTNTSNYEVNWDTCPAYVVTMAPTVEVGTLNCLEGPTSLGPGEQVAYAMEAPAIELEEAATLGVPLTWQLGAYDDRGPSVRTFVTIVR